MSITAPQYFQQIRLDNGDPAAFAKLYAYLSESSTPKPIYYDEDLTSPCPQPLLADAGGNLPQYFMGSGSYRFVVKDQDGNTLATRDGITATGTTPAAIDHNQLGGLQGGLPGDYYHMTNAAILDLTDGGESAGHYHATDRDRANHTGTQTAATISDLSTSTVPEGTRKYYTDDRVDSRIDTATGIPNGIAGLDSGGYITETQYGYNVALTNSARTWTAAQNLAAGSQMAGSGLQTAAMKGVANGIAPLNSSGWILENSKQIRNRYQAIGAPDAGFGAFPPNRAGKSWVKVIAAEANQWRAMAYGNETFVAASIDGTNRVMRSIDNGATWTAVAAAEANQWYAMAYGNGVFVAVALDGANRVMRSLDNGATWTAVAAAEANQWVGIAYGNGAFVAVANSGTNRVMRSSDNGATWTAVAAPSTGTWRSVEYGGGVFVAVAQDGSTRIMRSLDNGLTWETISAPEANAWLDISYGNGAFVAVANSGTNRVMRSSDNGQTWSAVAASEASSWLSISYGNGVFIAVASGGTNRVMRSSDNGATWTSITGIDANSWLCVTAGGGGFVAVASSGTYRVIQSQQPVFPPVYGAELPGSSKWVQTSSVTVQNTTTETSIWGGAITIGANRFYQARQKLSILSRGRLTAANSHTLTVKIKLNESTVVTSTVAITLPALAATNFRIEANAAIRTVGTSGTIWFVGGLWYTTTTGNVQPYFVPFGPMTAAQAIDTTVSNTLDVTVTWGTANAGDIIIGDLGELDL